MARIMFASARILIVDDERGIRRLLHDYLSRQGLRIFLAEDSAQARETVARQATEQQPIDVAVIDIRMPGEDGLSLARFLRAEYDLGIIILTASGEVVDRIVGLEVGADDYIAKPFEPRELLARIKSLLRRLPHNTNSDTNSDMIRLGNCCFDSAKRRLLSATGDPIMLTPLELDLLSVLLQHANQVLNRDQLLNLTQGRDWEPYDRSIDVRILRLRRKLEDNPSQPQIIKTAHRKGYMLVLDE